MTLSAQVMYDEGARILQNVVIFVGDGDVRAGDCFVMVCYLLHPFVVQRLYLKCEIG